MKSIGYPLVLLLGGALLTGCSIKNDEPDFRYPSRTNYSDHDWPKLAVTEELVLLGENADTAAGKALQDTDQIAERARRLRARARALKNAASN